MELILVRHGEAHPAIAGNDIKRPLTARGHEQAKQTAEFVQQHIQPDIFVVSPLLRAQETLSHIQSYFPDVEVLICDRIKPDDDPEDAIEWLSVLPHQHIVVVCHMNVIGGIAQKLTLDVYDGFALAEARVYDQTVIANGLSTEKSRFSPII